MIYSKVSFLVLFYSYFTRLTFVLVRPSFVQTVHLGTRDNCYCGGLILSSSQAPIQLLTHSCPHSRMGDRRGKASEKTCLIGEGKRKGKPQTVTMPHKQNGQSPSTGHFGSQKAPFSFSIPVFIAEHDTILCAAPL